MLSKKEKLALRTQRVVSYCLFIVLGSLVYFLFKYKFKYQADNVKRIRQRYKEILDKCQGPVILCTNHLTLIDSIIQTVILNSISGYLLNFSSFPWNLPEKKNFYHKPSWKILCYLGKCIPVQRMSGPKNNQRTAAQIQYVLSLGEVISIFPEGKRSRSGIIDDVDFSYGTGDILKNVEHATVICLYLRGRSNKGFSDFPEKGEKFYLDIDVFHPVSENSGLRKVRDLSTQIITKLKNMENKYLENETHNRQ
jgi:1-acyl-sn-glycerol-3-phosphate acyltransferase